MYPSTTLFVALGQLAIIVLVLFSYPLQVHPCRNCLDKVFDPAPTPKVVASASEDSEDSDGEAFEDPDHGGAEMSAFKHTLLTTGIIILGYLIAYEVDDLQLGACAVAIAL